MPSASLTLARGGGKTTFTAEIACAALNGPLAEAIGAVLIVASSFDQGLVAFRHCQHFLAPEIEADRSRWRIQDSANRASITDWHTGAALHVFGSDPRRGHGRAPKLILADEVAQWPENLIGRMLAALETSRGKIPGSKMLWLGTRARKRRSPFRGRAFRKSAMPRCTRRSGPIRLFSVEPGARLTLAWTGNRTWKRLKTALTSWAWNWGRNAAMSAAAAYWMLTGGLEAFAVFPVYPDLRERGRRDGVDRLYVECLNRGELLTAGQRVSDVGALLGEVRWGDPATIVLRPWAGSRAAAGPRSGQLSQLTSDRAGPRLQGRRPGRARVQEGLHR